MDIWTNLKLDLLGSTQEQATAQSPTTGRTTNKEPTGHSSQFLASVLRPARAHYRWAQKNDPSLPVHEIGGSQIAAK